MREREREKERTDRDVGCWCVKARGICVELIRSLLVQTTNTEVPCSFRWDGSLFIYLCSEHSIFSFLFQARVYRV